MKHSRYRTYGKRLLDLTLVVAAAPLILPLLALIAFLVRGMLGRPVLFRQERTGLNGRTFELIKFRSMSDEFDAEGRALPDAERLTRFGKFLRATSLDELPELWNVLRGEMSLVGPRPLLPKYLPRYSASQARRHEVLPGLTGWAQVNGRNEITWNRKFQLDQWYVDNCSLTIDLRILIATIVRVIQRD